MPLDKSNMYVLVGRSSQRKQGIYIYLVCSNVCPNVFLNATSRWSISFIFYVHCMCAVCVCLDCGLWVCLRLDHDRLRATQWNFARKKKNHFLMWMLHEVDWLLVEYLLLGATEKLGHTTSPQQPNHQITNKIGI